ncbi:hypothetical protein SIO17_05890 [Pseudoalteromonas piscicida]|uniref:Lipoprotein n=1 Tax=Pseudoalteromonas piscicida TaxID=43662 RepID=A0ABM6NCH8_PSEO7|nr:hypothetical protein [Pseudoalteromonas piscicida]ATD06544.1 hypothetical protein PPIS_a1416 [Pseudoalteromonas piscicida]WPU33259.1 hypothetical protein SIO17_05890 [Pseudoalteromonas piscicida]
MRHLLLTLTLLYASTACSTVQISEIFKFEGEKFSLEVMPEGKSPLESLYTFDEILSKLNLEGGCSANWRGYQGTWEVIDDELYLVSLVKGACSDNPPLVDPSSFFETGTYPIKAKWFSEEIKIRLSEDEYIDCESSKSNEHMIGYRYDATIYKFDSGNLTKKYNDTVEVIFDHEIGKCLNQQD